MRLFFGRITGCLKPSEGTRRYKVLDFLISDFLPSQIGGHSHNVLVELSA